LIQIKAASSRYASLSDVMLGLDDSQLHDDRLEIGADAASEADFQTADSRALRPGAAPACRDLRFTICVAKPFPIAQPAPGHHRYGGSQFSGGYAWWRALF